MPSEILELNRELLARLFSEGVPDSIQQICSERFTSLGREHWETVRGYFRQLCFPDAVNCDCSGSIVTFGSENTLPFQQQEILRKLIQALIPWRKGPFSIFGEAIDAEWRSDLKWQRISSAIPPLAGLRVLDVGCNNGYYLFRASAHGTDRSNPPECLLGIDPSEAFFFAFNLFQQAYRFPNLEYELLGIEHLLDFSQKFDVALCLGIVYHQRDPLRSLQLLRNSLAPGGTAIIESQTIPGTGSVALFPSGRYAKAHNVYFIPTRDCLSSWIKRAGFSNIELISETPVTIEEQRKTAFMSFESLAEFLSPNNPTQTIEGYPAPWRTAFRACRSS